MTSLSMQSVNSPERTSAPRLSMPIMLAAVCVAALVERWLVMPNANVAWLLTVAERMLDGQQIYVDTIETNPPFSIWLYLPAALLGRLLPFRAEYINDALIFAAAGLSIRATIGTLRRAGLMQDAELRLFALASTVVLLVLPAACFGEREHVAAIAFLPFIAVTAARASGHKPSLQELMISAGCMGFIIAVKPPFAFAIGAPILLAAFARRDWRILLSVDYVVGELLAAVYAASTLFLHPAFWAGAMDLNAALYLPVRYPIAQFLWHFADLMIAFCALLVVSALRGWKGASHVSTLIAAGALGFMLAVVLQAKGMPYHFYPPLGLAALAAFATAGRRSEGLPTHQVLSFALACVFWTWFEAGFDMRVLVDPIRRAAEHPRVLALGYDFSAGPPVARAAGGTYVGRVASQWISDNANWLKPYARNENQRAQLDVYIAMDRHWFLEDLESQRPDVLLIQREPEDWTPYAESDARFKSALADFRPEGTYESGGLRNATQLRYDLWIRKQPAR